MKSTDERIVNLLALKRHEQPKEGYWQDFLCEFHHRQRQRSVANFGWFGVFERMNHWFSNLGSAKWTYGACLAYAAVTISLFLTPRQVEEENAPAAPVNYQVVPAPAPPPAPMVVEQPRQLNLSPSAQGSVGEQVF